jgi:hypothetical protein
MEQVSLFLSSDQETYYSERQKYNGRSEVVHDPTEKLTPQGYDANSIFPS